MASGSVTGARRCWTNQSRAAPAGAVEVLHVRVEVCARKQHQLLGLPRLFVRSQRQIGWHQVVASRDHQEQRRWADPLDVRPGSYSVNISTLRSVTSFRQAGARVLPVSLNQAQESGVGSAEGAIGSGSTT